MTRLAIAAAFALLFSASPAAAQWDGGTASAAFALTAPTDLHADTLSAATSQHRVGTALIAAGLTANVAGAAGSFVSLIGAFSTSEEPACIRAGACSGSTQHTDWGAMFGASVGFAAVGLVMFFIGLGLDIHAHVLRGHAGEVRLSGDGLAVTF